MRDDDMNVNLLSLDSLSLIEDSDHVMGNDECDKDAGGNVNVWIKSSLSSVVICGVTCLFLSEVNHSVKDVSSTGELYLQACQLVGVVPARYFLRHLGCDTINMNHHGLGPLGGKALAIALVTDMNITTLQLADNCLSAEGARYVTQMLRANFTIQHLDLSNNNLQSAGADCVAKMLLENISMKSLKLSGNKFAEDDARWFADAFAVNSTLKHLDLSWNGFSNEGALALGEALKFNNTLVHLNLNNNRITDEGVSMLCKGLEANDTLRVLKNVLVNENFVQLLELICQERLGLEVQYGGVGGFIAKKPRKRTDPMKIIQDYLDQRKLRLWDFFRHIDKDGTMRVSVVDFRKAVQQSSIPLEKFQIEELIQRLDRDGTGIVDYSLLTDRFLYSRGLADTRKQMMRDHRRQLRKVESRQKKEKQKSDRILKTFESAVEAVTPRGSMIISPSGAREDWTGPQHFSATPLSSWHHIIMSNSSRYSVQNMSSEHVHLPMIGGAMSYKPPSSADVRSYSQPNLSSSGTKPAVSKPTSIQRIHSTSNPSVLSPTANLTRSRPALNTQDNAKAGVKSKKKKTKKRKDVISNGKSQTIA
ncbi:Leucine-rich repeat-containing protein 74A [Triplophysa tibetana]|uniref:Leucine-rich repeat-containing protein 74A n=1 Tax=Triplophysa tibetana TaxID=1572043 RepID=A0A5A9NR31_9TELE|nr:Leucine-rich repeat-containing protein 74A [Triplophysa tibetana]